jgi:hypothetical protein
LVTASAFSPLSHVDQLPGAEWFYGCWAVKALYSRIAAINIDPAAGCYKRSFMSKTVELVRTYDRFYYLGGDGLSIDSNFS